MQSWNKLPVHTRNCYNCTITPLDFKKKRKTNSLNAVFRLKPVLRGLRPVDLWSELSLGLLFCNDVRKLHVYLPTIYSAMCGFALFLIFVIVVFKSCVFTELFYKPAMGLRLKTSFHAKLGALTLLSYAVSSSSGAALFTHVTAVSIKCTAAIVHFLQLFKFI